MSALKLSGTVAMYLIWATFYVGTAGAKAPQFTEHRKFKWRVSYSEFVLGSEGQKENKDAALGTGEFIFSFPKVGWSCVITPTESVDINYYNEAYRVGCTNDQSMMAVVTHYCLDNLATMSPVLLVNKKSKFQGRIIVSCDSLDRK